jgi:protein TonB
VSSSSGTGGRLAVIALTATVSLALHASGLAAASRLEPRAPVKPAPVEVEFEAVTPPPLREEPPPSPRPLSPKRVAMAKLPRSPKDLPPPPPPPPNDPPQKEERPAKVAPRVGVSLSSTTVGGEFAVGVGNTLHGKAPEVAADPKDVKPYREEGTAPSPKVSRQPRCVLDRDQLPPYPPAARRAGVEGQVMLLLHIDAQGRVLSARVQAEPGYGLGEAARANATRIHCSPGLLEGEPVEVPDFPYRYTFVLE